MHWTIVHIKYLPRKQLEIYLTTMLDHPVFKMSFFFLLIISATIFLVGVSGYYNQDATSDGCDCMLRKFFKFE